MGMHEMREELEDLAFRELNPDAYKVVSERLDALEARNVGLIAEIEQQLTKKLADRGIAAEVTGRRKRAYSIWRKMERKSVGFEQLSDIFGFRVIVKTLAECYQALGIVHTTWPVVPGRFKDYISTPKQNDYRSIHTTVIGPGKQRVELQIRTREMHEIAEYGIAAHALYKDGVGSPTEMLSRESSAYAWLRRTIELLAEGSNPEEFLEHTKLELFHDQVFCFTPKGKLIALPREANADRLRLCGAHRRRQHGGRLQDQRQDRAAGLRAHRTATRSRSSPRRRRPRRRRPGNRSSITGKARAAIRRATRVAVRDQYAGLGRRIVERLCQRAKIAYSDEKLTGALPRLARASIEEVMSAVGRGEMRAADVARAMYPDYKEERAAAIAQQPKAGKRLVRPQALQIGEVQGARDGNGRRDPDPRHQQRPAGALRARRRRGAGRPHRRHPDAGRRHHHLSDPVAGAEGFRGQAGALARRALGRGRAHAAAFSRAHRAAVGQRAGLARADRAGDRRARRQYRQHPHGAALAGFHRR